MVVQLPTFTPREYQKPLLKAIIEDGVKRAFCIWHRRAGKDLTLMNIIAYKAMEKVGTYYYFFPTYTQAKKVIWDGINGEGKRFIDYFPEEIVAKKNEQEMKVEFVNGSVFQLVGTDKYDAVRGTNPIGCVFSEYAFQNPMAYEVVRPILAQNGGWAIFNTTPNGKNHSYDLWEAVKDNPNWFAQLLTVDDTKVISAEFILEEKRSGMTPEMIQQEYYCSHDIGQLGSIYGEQMTQAWKEKRITELPFSLEKPVDVHFDLGISKGNETAIWFHQKDGQFFNFVNYYEASGKGFDHYATYIEEYLKEKNGKLGTVYVPHDANKREWTTEVTAVQAFQKRFGEHKVVRLNPDSPSDTGGLQKARAILPRCRFDKENCRQGIRCLENYQYEYDQLKKVFRGIPLHNWASNGSDAFRYFAISVKERGSDPQKSILKSYEQVIKSSGVFDNL